jgi:hypothetical protein
MPCGSSVLTGTSCSAAQPMMASSSFAHWNLCGLRATAS